MPFVCCDSFNNIEKLSNKKIGQQNVKRKMADTFSYISGDLLCAFLPLFVDGILSRADTSHDSVGGRKTKIVQ